MCMFYRDMYEMFWMGRSLLDVDDLVWGIGLKVKIRNSIL